MDDSILQNVWLLLAAGVIGVLVGLLIHGAINRRGIGQLDDAWQEKLDDLTRERGRLATEISSLRSTIETQQADISKYENSVAKSRTELQSAHEKEKLMAKSLFTLRAEREDFKNRLVQFQNALVSVKQQSIDMQTEFVKSSEIYKSELRKAFEKRKALEVRLDNAKLENESSDNLLKSSQSEQEAINKMFASAKNRLANLDILEHDVIRLQAENAQLNHDASGMKQEIEVLQRDVDEIDELKVQNQELTHCLTSVENSRKQHEYDAKRYREQASETERKSETMRIKLDEVEKNFVDMEKQQRYALIDARRATAAQTSNGQTPRKKNRDDLKKIIGIGKKFELALHELGVFSFEQIANFGVADIARVNLQLKEFRGRMEQDDWIGQAKELHFAKYGGANVA